jgi:hypothetical protein
MGTGDNCTSTNGLVAAIFIRCRCASFTVVPFEKAVPLSQHIPGRVVFCEFHTRPMLWRQGRGLGGPLRTGSFAPADQRRDVLATEIVQNRLMLRRMPVRARFCSPRSP